MKLGLMFSLLLSVLLVGTASWSRFIDKEEIRPAGVVAVEQIDTTDNDYQEILKDFITPKTSTSTTPAEPLTNTDIIGREMILDYIGLAANGQATDVNLNALAPKYVESIPAFSPTISISSSEIQTVQNTRENFSNYANKLAQIYTQYANDVSSAQITEPLGDSFDDSFYAYIKVVENSYKNSAEKLKNMPAPLALAQNHLRLINIHLSNYASARSIIDIENDPVIALAGFVAIDKNLNQERIVLGEVSQILKTNGI